MKISKKDNLFAASRFVLPEHRELYLELKRDQELIPQPILEEDELMEIQYRIQDSMQYDYTVTLRWWEPVKNGQGRICEMWGWVKAVDNPYRVLKLVNDKDSQWIDMDRIIEVRRD
ncbi:MAG: YolD-like family protein [Brevibacillus sp.]|nr:YolD-like family protein [Brevibacillus sp.]